MAEDDRIDAIAYAHADENDRAHALLIEHIEATGHEAAVDYELGPYCATCSEKES